MSETYGDVPYIHPELNKKIDSDRELQDLKRKMTMSIIPREFDSLRARITARIQEILDSLTK